MSYEKKYIWDSMHTTGTAQSVINFPSLNSSNFSNFTFSWCWCCRVCDWGSQKILFLSSSVFLLVFEIQFMPYGLFTRHTYKKNSNISSFSLLLFLLAANATTCYHSFSLFSLSFFLWLYFGDFFSYCCCCRFCFLPKRILMWEKEK